MRIDIKKKWGGEAHVGKSIAEFFEIIAHKGNFALIIGNIAHIPLHLFTTEHTSQTE